MVPRDERHTPQDDLFRSELVNLIDPCHPLVKLADRIDWSVFEGEWNELFASPTGRPAAPPRLIAGLHHLQHAYNLSDDAVVERKIEDAADAARAAFQEPLHRANRLLSQTRKSRHKLLSWHAPEVEVIGKGKVAKPWEFGVKVSVAVTNRESLVVGCRSMLNNPFDGHTLTGTLEQTEILSGVAPKRCYVDRGYQGAAVPGVRILRSGQKRGVNTRTLKRELIRADELLVTKRACTGPCCLTECPLRVDQNKSAWVDRGPWPRSPFRPQVPPRCRPPGAPP